MPPYGLEFPLSGNLLILGNPLHKVNFAPAQQAHHPLHTPANHNASKSFYSTIRNTLAHLYGTASHNAGTESGPSDTQTKGGRRANKRVRQRQRREWPQERAGCARIEKQKPTTTSAAEKTNLRFCFDPICVCTSPIHYRNPPSHSHN